MAWVGREREERSPRALPQSTSKSSRHERRIRGPCSCSTARGETVRVSSYFCRHARGEAKVFLIPEESLVVGAFPGRDETSLYMKRSFSRPLRSDSLEPTVYRDQSWDQ